MGYCCMPYRVDFERLHRIRGSRDEQLLARVVELATEYGMMDDDDGDDDWDDEEESFVAASWRALKAKLSAARTPALPPVPRAAWEMLHRNRLDDERAELYVYALQLMCLAIGAPLDNVAVAPAAPVHFDAVEEALKSAGLTKKVSMMQLVFGGPPIAIPETDDFPSIGYLAPATVKGARGLIAQHDWSARPVEVQATLRLLDTWIEDAASKGEGLVCIYS